MFSWAAQLTATPDATGTTPKIELQLFKTIDGTNFVSYGDAERTVTTTTAFQKDTNQVVITVSDEGRGITEEDLKHIMDPFFTTKRDSGGTGLGLSISYNIIKDHGGDLKIESEQGKGTKAIVTLPAVS